MIPLNVTTVDSRTDIPTDHSGVYYVESSNEMVYYTGTEEVDLALADNVLHGEGGSVEGDIDMNGNQLKNALFDVRDDDPTEPALGQIWVTEYE